ncbi:hypothetical protein B0H15DRAFT_1027588 [Mycena belliarum]|uniref:Uncharacterized protein n=1 Tax=Mycena belliarum TaxID=1033014 RepID=A0AAD6XLK1_9AGAR|nr:hypothetical protein B0H15DRAFT_1027588 [Mycena belliae]
MLCMSAGANINEIHSQTICAAKTHTAMSREENIVLRTENAMLKATNQSLMSALSNGPLKSASIQDSTPIPASVPLPLSQADYPDVKLWQRSKWTKLIDHQRGRSGGKKSSRNSLFFIEDSDGDAPTEDEKKEIRRFCYTFFFDLRDHNLAPPVWGQASLSTVNDFRAAAEHAYPILRLCHAHWKADQLATIVYFSWYGSHGNASKNKKIKDEPISAGDNDDGLDDEADNSDNDLEILPTSKSSISAKRLGTSFSTQRPTKRAKTEKPGPVSVAKVDNALKTNKKKKKNPLFGMTPATDLGAIPTVPTNSSQPTPLVDPLPPRTMATSLIPAVPTPPPAPALVPASTAPSPAPAVPTPPPALILTPTAPPPVSSIPVAAPAPTPALILGPTVSAPAPVVPTVLVPLVLTASAPSVLTPGAVDGTMLAHPINIPMVLPPAISTPHDSMLVPPAVASNSTLSKPARKAVWNPAHDSTTPRGLCALSYKRANPRDATAGSFRQYWDGLSKFDKTKWATQSQNASAASAEALQ